MIKDQSIKKIISSYLPEMIDIRHRIHSQPELGFEEIVTSHLVAKLLKQWGYEVTTNFAGTGVIGKLTIGEGKKSIGLRADMDALPIQEMTNLPYASKTNGVMHACGHDGHTTTLLAAARYLAQTKNFSGTVNVFFQPAEEGLGGGRRMVEEGLFEKFPCDAVYGFHNIPNMPLGKFCFIEGVATAASDRAKVIIKGKSGHGAQPQTTIDPIVVGSAIVTALQTIVSRNLDPLDSAVITVSSFHAGEAYNIIPETAELKLTIRSYNENIRKNLEDRIKNIVMHQASAFGAEAELFYNRIHPASINDAGFTSQARKVAESIFGKNSIIERTTPFTFSDDVAFMLEKCSGCYLFIGNGESANLHNDRYNFNDEIIQIGSVFWAHLVEDFLQ